MKWVGHNHPPHYKHATPPMKALSITPFLQEKSILWIYDLTGNAVEKHKVNSNITGPPVYSTAEIRAQKIIHLPIMNAAIYYQQLMILFI